jgi:hypothetical protein
MWRLINGDRAGSLVVVVVVIDSGLACVLISSVSIKDCFVVGPWSRLNVPSHNDWITHSDCETE